MKINGLFKAAANDTNGAQRHPTGPAKIRAIRGCF
jgi:hypothetical protein